MDEARLGKIAIAAIVYQMGGIPARHVRERLAQIAKNGGATEAEVEPFVDQMAQRIFTKKP